MIRLIAHTSIGAGLALWLDLFAHLTSNMDQVVMLIVVMAVVCLVADITIRRLAYRQPQTVDIRSLFEEV